MLNLGDPRVLGVSPPTIPCGTGSERVCPCEVVSPFECVWLFYGVGEMGVLGGLQGTRRCQWWGAEGFNANISPPSSLQPSCQAHVVPLWPDRGWWACLQGPGGS